MNKMFSEIFIKIAHSKKVYQKSNRKIEKANCTTREIL